MVNGLTGSQAANSQFAAVASFERAVTELSRAPLVSPVEQTIVKGSATRASVQAVELLLSSVQVESASPAELEEISEALVELMA
jgi:hypothetical protein